MTDVSPQLALPYLLPAQAQKHVTVNEALARLDLLVQAAVTDRTRTVPPALPVTGDRHIVAAGATGAWAGQDGRIAQYGTAGWEFVAPRAGWLVQILAETQGATFDGALWRTPDSQPQRFPRLGVNTDADTTNRLAVSAPASLLSHDGAGHQLKINKAAAADTASLLYQTGFSGRAEIGLAGDDTLVVKVSPDGSAWTTGLSVAAASGRIGAPQGVALGAGSAATPSLGFAGDADTGLWNPAADQIGLATGGTQRLLVGTAAVQSTLPVQGPAGSAAAPSLGFAGDADTGLWNAAADVLGLAAGGAERARVTTAGLQVTGLVSGTAVTQSATDTTANRLMKTGDFGLGLNDASLTDIADMDAHRLSGFFRWSSGATGAPGGAAAGAFVHLTRLSGTEHHQLAFTSNDRIWRRRWTGGAWGAWQEIWHAGSILGAVSQSAGVPTGRVIERGSNANGTFVRFADGTQICTQTATVNLTIATALMGGFRSAGQTWTYPAAFAAAPAVQGLALNLTAFGVATHVLPGTTSTGWVVTAVTSQTALDRTVALSANGRWF